MDNKKVIFTTKMVDDITKRIGDGEIIKKIHNPWLQGEIGIRRIGCAFKMTPDETDEYVKCATDIQYFANNYCKIKLEDGSVGQMRLRDYQKDILDLYYNNRFSILCSSRQIGKCILPTTFIDCEITKSNGNIHYETLPFYKLDYMYNENKSIYDYIKYFLYNIINSIKKDI